MNHLQLVSNAYVVLISATIYTATPHCATCLTNAHPIANNPSANFTAKCK